MMLRTPSAHAPSRSDCSAMTLRSRVVSWIIGASPSSIIHTAHASGDSFTVAAWLSVTLAACTDFANARAVRRTGSGTGLAGGPSSAVTTNSPDANTSANVLTSGSITGREHKGSPPEHPRPAWQTGIDGEPAGWPRPGPLGTGSRKVGAPQGRVLASGQSG